MSRDAQPQTGNPPPMHRLNEMAGRLCPPPHLHPRRPLLPPSLHLLPPSTMYVVRPVRELPIPTISRVRHPHCGRGRDPIECVVLRRSLALLSGPMPHPRLPTGLHSLIGVPVHPVPEYRFGLVLVSRFVCHSCCRTYDLRLMYSSRMGLPLLSAGIERPPVQIVTASRLTMSRFLLTRSTVLPILLMTRSLRRAMYTLILYTRPELIRCGSGRRMAARLRSGR